MKLRRVRAAAQPRAGSLDEVLAVERANADLLAAETATAKAWLAEQIANAAAAADARIADATARAVREHDEARELAERDANDLVRRAEDAAARLAGLSDDQLMAIVRARLAVILPGAIR